MTNSFFCSSVGDDHMLYQVPCLEHIILMIIRDRANHWSSVVYEATFSLALHPLGSDLVWFHLHQIVIKCIGCIINQRQTGKRCWLLNDFLSSLSGYTSEGEGGWWCGCWASEGGKKCNVRSLPQFQFRVDRGKVFFGSAAERSVGQEGRHTFLNRRVFM